MSTNNNPDGVTENNDGHSVTPSGFPVPPQRNKQGFRASHSTTCLCSYRPFRAFLISECIPLVIFNAVCLQKQFILLFERPLLVMLCLTADILHRLVDERRADGESAISLLPRESGIARVDLLHPFTAVGLDGADEVGQRHGLRQRREDMHVVGYAANFYGQPANALDDATDVGEDARQVFRPHLHARALDVEYQMNVDFY